MFSKEWQDKINDWEAYGQCRDYADIWNYYVHSCALKHENPVVLTEGVWILWYNPYCLRYEPRKLRTITANDGIYDGVYKHLYDTIALGSLSYKFKIDRAEIELHDEDKKSNQQKLLSFIKEQTGISDVELPKVPKGILKI